MCEKKRRWQQEKEIGVQFGLRAYNQFVKFTQNPTKQITYTEFVSSQFYHDFVRFGRYVVSINVINVPKFTEWLIREKKRIDSWCKDSVYEEWLVGYIRKESVQDAMERALTEMTQYAEETSELLTDFSEYFKKGNSNRICYHVTSGKISPWVLYHCASGIEFLENLPEPILIAIMRWISPDYWQKKFETYPEDADWCKHILKEAGL